MNIFSLTGGNAIESENEELIINRYLVIEVESTPKYYLIYSAWL